MLDLHLSNYTGKKIKEEIRESILYQRKSLKPVKFAHKKIKK